MNHLAQSAHSRALLDFFSVEFSAFAPIKAELRNIERGLQQGDNTHGSAILASMEKSQPNTLCRFEHIIGASQIIQEWEAQHIRPQIEQIVGRDLHLFKDKANLKLPGSGAFGCHQDFAAYQHFEPREFFTAMIAIDPMTEINGCLEFATNTALVAEQRLSEATEGGAHLFPICYANESYGDIVPEIAEQFEWRKIELAQNKGVVFDGFIPHRSAKNISDHPRRALFLTYNPAEYGDHYAAYYKKKMADPMDPIFHVSVPSARGAAVK